MNLETRDAGVGSGPAVETLGVLETAALLRELTAGLISVTDLDEALGRLVRITRDAVPGVSWCGFTVLRAGEPAGAAASDERLAELDAIDLGPDSPAMTAIHRRELVLAEDLATERRWPTWTTRARSLGVRAVLAVPVDVDEQVIGAVTLYADAPGAMTTPRQLTAMLLAEHAGLLLAAVRDRANRAVTADEEDESSTGGGVVGHAVGVIMTQRGCPAPEALQVLRDAATALDIPLHVVAERLVTTVARPRDS